MKCSQENQLEKSAKKFPCSNGFAFWLTCLCLSISFSMVSNLLTSSFSRSTRATNSSVFVPGLAPLKEKFHAFWIDAKLWTKMMKYLSKVLVIILPLDGIFCLFFNESDSFQYICNIVNSPFLAHRKNISSLCLKNHLLGR